MRDLRWFPSRTAWSFLILGLLCLASGAARSQTVSAPYNVWVQPIDVCNSAGTSCAPINSKNQSILNGPNTPVGFFDPTSGANITQSIILNQLGVNVVFLPVVQYNSAANVSPTGAYPAADYRTLHVVTNNPACGLGLTGVPATGSQSCDFLVLSQQPAISQGSVPSPTTPPGVPVASDPATINMFFVNTLVPANGGQLYGFSWVGNNGVAISMNTLLGVALCGTCPPRPDTLAHEIGHDLNLDHNTFGAGPQPTPTSACSTTPDTGCTVNLMTAGGVPGMNLRFEPTIANALPDLSSGTADQLNVESQENTTLPISQQREVLASGFIKATLPAMLTATK